MSSQIILRPKCVYVREAHRPSPVGQGGLGRGLPKDSSRYKGENVRERMGFGPVIRAVFSQGRRKLFGLRAGLEIFKNHQLGRRIAIPVGFTACRQVCITLISITPQGGRKGGGLNCTCASSYSMRLLKHLPRFPLGRRIPTFYFSPLIPILLYCCISYSSSRGVRVAMRLLYLDILRASLIRFKIKYFFLPSESPIDYSGRSGDPTCVLDTCMRYMNMVKHVCSVGKRSHQPNFTGSAILSMRVSCFLPNGSCSSQARAGPVFDRPP